MNETRAAAPNTPGMIELIRKTEQISYENVIRLNSIMSDIFGKKSDLQPQAQPECLMDDVSALHDYTVMVSQLLGQLNALMVGG